MRVVQNSVIFEHEGNKPINEGQEFKEQNLSNVRSKILFSKNILSNFVGTVNGSEERMIYVRNEADAL